MKLFVFHGPGIVAQNSRLAALKKSFDPNSITELDGKEVSQAQLRAALSQTQLFSPERLLIIDTPPAADLSSFSEDEPLTIVLKFPKPLPSNSLILKEAGKYSAQVVLFSEEKEETIFPFLDALASRNPKAFTLFEVLFKQYGSQYLLTMIAFLLRRFINSPKNLPPYISQKIAGQRRNFSNERVRDLYKAVLETDFKIKSGILEEHLAAKLLTQRFFE